MKLKDILDSVNVAEDLDEDELNRIGNLVVEEYELDEDSRKDWKDQMQEASKLALQIKEDKTFPWPNAANVKFPALTIACLQFHARAYPQLVNPNLVKCKIFGSDRDGLKRGRADRISAWMNYQIMERDEYWDSEQDGLLMVLPLMGCMFKKTYQDEYTRSEAVMPEYLVADYYAKNCSTANRLTHILEMRPVEVKERMLSGRFLDIELSTPEQTSKPSDQRSGKQVRQDKDAARVILEQHRYLDLDEDDYPEPYIVTVDKTSKRVLRIVPRIESITYNRQAEIDALIEQIESIRTAELPMQQKFGMIEQAESAIEEIIAKSYVTKIEPIHYFTKYTFLPHPDGSFYDLGFGALLGPINETINTAINQLLDAGTMQVANAGFIGRGARMKGGRLNFEPFEWKQVNATGGDLRNNILPLPVNEPSGVLFNLLTLMIDYSQRLMSVSDMMQGVTPGQNTPMTTSMASLDQAMKVFNGIMQRIYRAMTAEFKKIYQYQRENVDIEEYLEFHDNEMARSDFEMDPKDVRPSADPSATTDEKKAMRAQFIAERSMSVPGYNPQTVERLLLEAMGIPDIAEVYDIEQFPPGEDPELELKRQDQQRKDMETQARIMTSEVDNQIKFLKLESEIEEREARIQKAIAESAAIINDITLEAYRAITERMKVRLGELKQQASEGTNGRSEGVA